MVSYRLDKVSIKEMNTEDLVDRLRELGERSLHKSILDEALKTVDEISPAENRTRVLAEIAENLFKSSLEKLGTEVYNRLLDSSSSIDKYSDRAKTLADIGKSFFEIDKEMSKELFDKSLETARNISDDSERIKSMIHIAENQIDIGSTERGSLICDEIFEDALKLAEDNQKILPLVNIAGVLAKSGNVQKSIEICEKAKLLADELSDSNERCWVLGRIGVVYTEANKIESTIKIAEKICSEDEGNLSLGEIMISLSEKGEVKAALDLRRCIPNNDLCDSILSDLAGRLANKGRADEAEYITGLIENPEEKEWVQKEIAIVKASEGEIIKAIDITQTLVDNDIKILALTEIAKILIKKGEENKLKRLIELILELSENGTSDSVEVDIVEVLADTGFLDLAIDRARDIETSEEKAIALSYVSAKSGGITSLSQDFLNTLESIRNEKGEIDGKIKDELKNIALKLSENISRKDIYESIDSIHDVIDSEDR